MNGRGSTRSSLAEGLRNALAVTPFGVMIWLVTAAVISAGALAESAAVEMLLRAEHEWVEDGGTILIAEAKEGAIDPGRCEALNSLSGVEASFAVRRSGTRFEVASQPGGHITVIGATVGVADFFHLPGGASGAIVAASESGAATEASPYLVLREVPGGASAVDEFSGDAAAAPLPVAARTSLDALGEEFARSILIPTATLKVADQCFIRTTLPDHDGVKELAGSFLARTADQDIKIRPRLSSGALTMNASQRYSERWAYSAPLIAGLALAFMWILRWWMGRRDDALYRTLGANHANLVVLRLVQALVDVALGALVGVAGVLLGILVMRFEYRASLIVASLAVGVCLGAAFAVGLVFQLLWPRRKVVERLRE